MEASMVDAEDDESDSSGDIVGEYSDDEGEVVETMGEVGALKADDDADEADEYQAIEEDVVSQTEAQ